MKDEEVLTITQYIAAWSWQLMAVMFLISMFFAYILDSLPFLVAFIVAFSFCELMALKRKFELEGDK